jgi:hypothetical protein
MNSKLLAASIVLIASGTALAADNKVSTQQIPLCIHLEKPIPFETFEKLKGKSTAEIVRAVGFPLRKTMDGDGTEIWYYGGDRRIYLTVKRSKVICALDDEHRVIINRYEDERQTSVREGVVEE